MRKVTIGDWCTLYHADSTAIVDLLRSHEPDAVITDPPYGLDVGSTSSSHLKLNFGEGASYLSRGSLRVHGDKEGPDILEWVEMAPEVIIWGADHLRNQLPDGGRFIAWDKLEGVESWDSFSDVEFAWHNRKGKATIISFLWKGAVCRKTGENNGQRYHSMQKPIRVMDWCIEQCRLNHGATILDPYMGSATTAMAAHKAGMRFVGVEIESHWFDIAVDRIQRQGGNGPLFDKVREVG